MATPEADAQLTREDLAELTPAEISQAYAAGRCDVLLGRSVGISEAISGLARPAQH